MVDMIYLAQVDDTNSTLPVPIVVEKYTPSIQESGLLHSKVAGRFEIVKKLPEKAESFDEMFDYADAYGKLRLAYIDSAHKISTYPKIEKKATAIGGELGINTASLNGFGFHITGYFSQSLSFMNSDKQDLNEDFFNTDRESFIYIGEANLKYSNNFIYVKIGRVKVETPYANSDDIRIAANTFEGAWSEISYSDKLKTQLMFVNRWAGYDSQDEAAGASQDQFKNLVNEDAFGMITVSLTYEYADDSQISIWYNYIDEMSAITYAEIVGLYVIDENLSFDYGLQVSNLMELQNSNVAGNILGSMAIINYHGAYLAGAYNIALVEDGNYITNGFGGGPYYTSLDEATIEAVSESSRRNSEAFRIGAGYNFSEVGVDGLILEFVYGQLYHSSHVLEEDDAILKYDIRDRWSFQTIYTSYHAQTDDVNDFDRLLVKLDYSF